MGCGEGEGKRHEYGVGVLVRLNVYWRETRHGRGERYVGLIWMRVILNGGEQLERRIRRVGNRGLSRGERGFRWMSG